MVLTEATIGCYLYAPARIIGLVLAAPFFNAVTIPIKIKLVLIVLLSILINSQIPAVEINVLSLNGIIVFVTQFCIGIVMGLCMQFAFQIVSFAGQILALQCGLGYATIIDPNSHTSLPIISQFYVFLMTLIFLSFDGHLLLLKIVFDSFGVLPIGSQLSFEHFYQIALYSAQIFAGGMTIALPAVIALLVINLTFSVMSRTSPSLNIMSMSFSFILLLGLVIIAICLPNMLNHTQMIISESFSLITHEIV